MLHWPSQASRSWPPKLSAEIPASFVAFDMLAWDGTEHAQAPLAERRSTLETVASDFVLSPMTLDRDEALEWLSSFEAIGLDGVIAKRRDRPYAAGARDAVAKVKPEKTADCVVIGVRWMEHKNKPLLLFFVMDNGPVVPEALRTAIYQSSRYISDRHLPDKAIDVIDEAGARVKLRRVRDTQNLRRLEQEIRQVVKEMKVAISDKDFERAVYLREREIELREDLEQLSALAEENAVLEVTAEDIEEVIASWTGVPVSDLLYEAGLPPQMLQVVSGDPREIADELLTNRHVDLITFTGGVPIGKYIAKTAGYKRMVLELGRALQEHPRDERAERRGMTRVGDDALRIARRGDLAQECRVFGGSIATRPIRKGNDGQLRCTRHRRPAALCRPGAERSGAQPDAAHHRRWPLPLSGRSKPEPRYGRCCVRHQRDSAPVRGLALEVKRGWRCHR